MYHVDTWYPVQKLSSRFTWDLLYVIPGNLNKLYSSSISQQKNVCHEFSTQKSQISNRISPKHLPLVSWICVSTEKKKVQETHAMCDPWWWAQLLGKPCDWRFTLGGLGSGIFWMNLNGAESGDLVADMWKKILGNPWGDLNGVRLLVFNVYMLEMMGLDL